MKTLFGTPQHPGPVAPRPPGTGPRRFVAALALPLSHQPIPLTGGLPTSKAALRRET
ncbi:hypothetical protein GCM10023107_60950 [Actinoplanes octamycinicus]